jgi:hypothetical protein
MSDPVETLEPLEFGQIRGLVARSLEESPEMREPPPLTPTEVNAYATSLVPMGYPRLVRERELLENIYEQLEAALPPWRLQLDLYPHPVVQQRLLVLNEWYRRGVADPEMAYNYNRNRAMLEWGAAGSVIGGMVGYFTKEQMWLGAAVGGVLGGVAGRSELFQTLLMSLSARAVML